MNRISEYTKLLKMTEGKTIKTIQPSQSYGGVSVDHADTLVIELTNGDRLMVRPKQLVNRYGPRILTVTLLKSS